jgi:hypothetical protein
MDRISRIIGSNNTTFVSSMSSTKSTGLQMLGESFDLGDKTASDILHHISYETLSAPNAEISADKKNNGRRTSNNPSMEMQSFGTRQDCISKNHHVTG